VAQGYDAPRLIVGLGNPGDEYVRTRHNVGFDSLDLWAQRLQASPTWLKAGGERIARIWRSPDQSFALLWPMNYMNRSGRAVKEALKWLEATPASLFVITDDFHLPLGALRVRPGGSPGGHNGLASIEDYLGTSEFARLRIGVGDPGNDSVDFVLSRFRKSEQETVEETLESASWVAEDFGAKGMSCEDLMARYNRRMP